MRTTELLDEMAGLADDTPDQRMKDGYLIRALLEISQILDEQAQRIAVLEQRLAAVTAD